MQAYSDPSRKADPHALPDVEIFYDDADIPEWGGQARNYDVNGEPVKPGWYYWFCFPGCLPDSDPIGPFESADAARQAAQEEC